MKIIYAYINGPAGADGPDRKKLLEFCKVRGLEPPLHVFSAGDLARALENVREEPVLLFSNFPPDSSYPRLNDTEKWKADSYAQSTALFRDWFANYKFAGIHFVTGAPEEVLSDDDLKSLAPEKKISIIRKNKWIGEHADFGQIFTIYIEGEIEKHLG